MTQDLKRNLILDAATKRFVHFGLAKTTMMDIANDLSMSKALLYYYFPDKNSLYTAVFENEIMQSHQDALEKIELITDVQEALMFLLDQRMDFVKRNYNLLDYSMTVFQQKPKEMSQLFQKARSFQQDLVGTVIKKGIDQSQIQSVPLEQVSEMIQYALEGMRWSVLKNLDGLPFPTQAEFDQILKMQKMLCMVLLNGLRTTHVPLGGVWLADQN